MKKNQSNRIIQQNTANLQAPTLSHHLANNRSALTTNHNTNASKVAQSQELLPKFYQQRAGDQGNNSNSLRQSSKMTTSGVDRRAFLLV